MKLKARNLNFLILFWLFFLFISLSAETLPLKIYTTSEGLAHDSVNKIVRDSHGFLWFCTVEGLSRFDGYKFKNYSQTQGLPHRAVNDFLETEDGTMLIATNLGIAVFNPKGRAYRWNVVESKLEKTGDEPEMFQSFFPETDNRQKKSILSLAQDNQGRIWAGSNFGLFRFEKFGEQDWRFREIEFADEKSESDSFLSFLQISESVLLIGSGGGIYRIGTDETPVRVRKEGAAAMLKDRRGNIWLDSGTKNLGLGVFTYENDSLKLLKTYTKNDGLPEDAFYFALKQTSDGRIFIGQHDGLSEFLPDAKENEPKFRILGKEKVTAMAEDSGGNLWIGTELRGTWKLANTGFTVYGEPDGIGLTDDIRGVYISRDGNVILPARPQKSLYLSNGNFLSITPFGLEKRSWSWHFLDLLSKDGEWWIPSANGLLRYPRVNNFRDLAVTPPKKIYTTADGLPASEIFNVFEDSRGDIWFTVIGVENSLIRWERRTDSLKLTTTKDNLPTFNGPISFAEDNSGNIWFGHYFNGLSRYRNGKFSTFLAKDGMPESQVIDLFSDSVGRLWIATTGLGLFRIDQPNDETPVITPAFSGDKLSSNQVLCLTEDNFGRIYIGTGRGINRIDQSGNVRIFTTNDGLPSNFTTRCSADKTGNLWFVSRNTLVRFDPKLEQISASLPVFIDKILINGVSQKISELGETNIETLELDSDQRQIQIDYFALTFAEGENIRYQYRLDAQDWSSPTEQQTLNLDLAPGKHDFMVRAVRSDNTASENPASASFRILPPVWARWWFVLLSSLFVGLLILSLYYYRTANLRTINAALTEAKFAEENLRKSKEERLAELEKVRSRIATDLHDDIGASLTQIAILSEVAQAQNTKDSGAASEPLKAISNVSNELVGTMSDIVWAINPSKDHISDLTQRMRRFAADILSSKGISLNFSATDADKEMLIGTNLRREVFLIFKESVNNIVKHSAAKHVEIGLKVSGKDLILKIADDGKGFAPEAESANLSHNYGGNGILSIKKRAVEMNGQLEIVSAAGKGTIVVLTLPTDKV